MPHFENIEQYEARKSDSGKKRIIPIAPHSLQVADYQPRKRSQAEGRKAAPGKSSKFAEVEFEPVSIRQMEREFKQASRVASTRRRKPFAKRLREFLERLKSLFSGTRSKAPAKDSKPRRTPHHRTRKKVQEDESGNRSGPPNRNRRRRKRGSNSGKSESSHEGNQSGRPSHPKGQGQNKSRRRRRGKGPPKGNYRNPNNPGKGPDKKA